MIFRAAQSITPSVSRWFFVRVQPECSQYNGPSSAPAHGHDECPGQLATLKVLLKARAVAGAPAFGDEALEDGRVVVAQVGSLDAPAAEAHDAEIAVALDLRGQPPGEKLAGRAMQCDQRFGRQRSRWLPATFALPNWLRGQAVIFSPTLAIEPGS